MDVDAPTTPSILVGFNDSDAAEAALSWAAEEARTIGARVEVLWVLPAAVAWELAAIQVDPEKRRRQMEDRLRKICARRLGTAGVPYMTLVREGSPTALLLHEADRVGARMIVVGTSHGGPVRDLLMGSVPHELAYRSSRPVVTVPASWRPTPHRAARATVADDDHPSRQTMARLALRPER